MGKLSTRAILQELSCIADTLQEEAIMSGNTFDINDFFEEANTLLETQILTEEEYKNHLLERGFYAIYQ